MRSYFTSPLAYAILGIFYFFAGWFFSEVFRFGQADSTYMFHQMFLVMLFLIPLLTMRLMSEDKRQKTDQALLTAPVSLFSVVGGKFLAAFSVFAIAMAIFVVLQIFVSIYAAGAQVSVDWLIFIGNMLGMLLLAGALIAIGLFISALTESQMVAAVAGFAASLLLQMMDSLAHSINIGFIIRLINGISFARRYNSFVNGILSYADVVFFLSVMALFIFLTVRVLDRKRWA